jgi:hypothetical protein
MPPCHCPDLPPSFESASALYHQKVADGGKSRLTIRVKAQLAGYDRVKLSVLGHHPV